MKGWWFLAFVRVHVARIQEYPKRKNVKRSSIFALPEQQEILSPSMTTELHTSFAIRNFDLFRL